MQSFLGSICSSTGILYAPVLPIGKKQSTHLNSGLPLVHNNKTQNKCVNTYPRSEWSVFVQK
jgi:hypothetical protein